MKDIVWVIVIGLAAGWAAARLTTGHGFGFFGNLVVGVLGSVAGAYLFDLLGLESDSRIGSFITATVGAIALLSLVGFLSRLKHRKR